MGQQLICLNQELKNYSKEYNSSKKKEICLSNKEGKKNILNFKLNLD
jgi:hypothetical protein